MKDCSLAFFSFVALDNPEPYLHRRYNEWHQLDHRPENLALPGVAWGDRWARTAECRADSTAEPEQADADYIAMYWFRNPVADAVREWEQLGVNSFEWGRGPMIPGVRRTLLAFFRPVKGYAAASSLVSPAVIPYRPNRGLHLTVPGSPTRLGRTPTRIIVGKTAYSSRSCSICREWPGRGYFRSTAIRMAVWAFGELTPLILGEHCGFACSTSMVNRSPPRDSCVTASLQPKPDCRPQHWGRM